MPPDVMKMPDPMTLPATSRIADPSPIARTRPSSSFVTAVGVVVDVIERRSGL